MELILRARPLDGDAVDLVVDVEVSHTVNELTAALTRQLDISSAMSSITLLRTGTVLKPANTVGESGIVSGD